MPQETLYTQILDLDALDVYLDTPTNDESYFSVRGLPEQIGYGKHFFTLSYKDPANKPLLATNSSIVFEFVDSNGTVVFSELADIEDTSGAATGYLWIKEDPLRTADNVFDGELTMFIVGTVTGVPDEFEGQRNLRSTFTFEVRKNKPNLSPIMLYDVNGAIASASFTETSEEDSKPGYTRGYINISASHLQTQGGKIAFAELSYRETGSRSTDFTLLNTFELDNDDARFEVDASGSQGLNPISTKFKTPIPKEIRRETPVIFKLRYLDENKSPAQYYDENRLNEQIIITSSVIDVDGSPIIIEREDNLLKGSMYTGQAVGKGFEQSGKNSAYLKTVDYTGFESASKHIGSPGVMFFSGSVLPGSGDNYTGVGLELVGNSESFFRYRSSPSKLEIVTKDIFVGSTDQFISASGGQLEISSSHFHLDPGGDVTFSGSIDASGGRIGGFEISSSRIQSTSRDLIMKSSGQISASSILLASSSFVIDPNNLTRFGADGFGSFVMANSTGVSIQTTDFNLNTARFIISSSDVGVMAMGSTPPLNFDNGKGFYVDGDGNFLAGSSIGERIQFNGFNLVMSSSAFFLGNEVSFMSGSNGKIRVSGSDIEIQTPRFLFGNATQFISGSNGNLEISSSNFHLNRDGDVKVIGRIEAESGFLGGFGITKDAITGSNFFISGAAVDNELFISSNNFNVKASGDITGSQVLFSGGTIGGFELASTQLNSTNDNLLLKSSGQITGSNVLFKGGKIAAFKLTEDALSTDSFFISASATGDDLFISASSFNVNAQGIVTASALSLEGGDVGGLSVAEGTIAVGDILKLKDSGQITGSNVLFTGGKIAAFNLTKDALSTTSFFISASATDRDYFISSSNFQVRATGEITGSTALLTGGKIAGWTISGDTLLGNNATLDGAGAALFKTDAGPDTDSSAATDELRNEYYIDFTPSGQGNTRNFFIKMGPNFMVDSDGILIASGATFIGTITASAGLIGGFTTDDHSFHGSNIFISGSPATGGTHHPRFMFISSSNFNVKENGDMTGSQVLFTGGKIAGWTIDDDVLSAGNVSLTGGSAASIKLGNLLNATGTGTTRKGFIADNDGNVLIKGSTSGNNYIKVDASGGSIDIKSQIFDLDAGTLILDSGTNDGKIALGATPPTSITTNQGFYADGTGDVLIGDADGQRISFDGSNLVMSSSTFFLGNETNFISGSTGNIKIQSSGETTLSGSGVNILTPQFFLGKKSTSFVSGSNGNIEISASSFHLDRAGNVTMSGSIVASDGQIGGFTINPNTITATNFTLDPSNKFISLGSGDDIFIADADDGIQLGDATFADAPFSVTKGGALKATSGTIGGFTIDGHSLSATGVEINDATQTLFISSSEFKVDHTGIITGSQVLFTGGKVAGFTLSGDTLTATNFTLDADNRTISLGSSNNIIIADADVGMQIGHASFASAPFSVTKAGLLKATSGTIGGWNLGADRIFSDNVNITSTGTIETSDFASGVKGWRISALNNGTAEFENAIIRGTMKTAVFEKETVNAVGGQLYVANSTVLTGSGIISASFNTMSVVNVSGFTGSYGGHGEILSLKKVSDTGFSTEYIKVESASRDDRTSDTNFAGKLFVVRGYSGSLPNNVGSSSLGDVANPAQDYNPGQVLVSTGVKDTGYIRLNANPTTNETPYIDIVERTGSAIYDIELKARLGDLKGLSSAQVGTTPGFGLFTEQAFLTKNVTVGTLATEHIVVDATSLKFIDNETTMAELRGTTWTLGGAHGATDDAIVMSPTNGVKIFDNSDEFILVDSTGLTVTESGAGVAKFSSTTTIGNTGTEHVEIKSNSLKLRDGTTDLVSVSGTTVIIGSDSNNRVQITPTSMQIGSSGGGITMDSSGNATFNGTIVIGSGLAEAISGSSSALSASLAAQVTAASSSAGLGMSLGSSATTAASNAQSTANTANTAAGNASTLASNLAAGSVASASAAQSGAETTAANLSAGAVASASAASASAAAGLTSVSSSAGSYIKTVSSAASTAQSAIDTMETQVVLSSAGMSLRNDSAVDVVQFGTTTKFFDGVDDTEANRKLQLNADGVFAFGANTGSFVRVFSEGVQIASHSVERAKFGGTTTIGNTATEHVEITSTTLKLKDGGTTRISMDSSGVQIGAVNSGITLNADGDATFKGEITIGSSLATAISGSASSLSASLAAQVTAASSSAGLGMSLGTSATTTANSAQSTANTAQSTANTANTAAGNASTLASNLAAGAEASASAAQSAAETTAANLSAGAVASASAAETNATTVASNLAAGSVASASAAQTAAETLASGLAAGSVASASAAQTAAELLASNLAAGARASASAATSAASTAQSAIDTMETQVVLSSAGMSLRNNSAVNVATFGTTTKFFDGVGHADSNRKLQLNADGIFAFGDDTTTFTKVSSAGIQLVKDNTDIGLFSNVVRVGALNQQHVSMSSAGITFMDSATQIGKISGNGALIGNTSNAHISASTTEINIIKDSNNKAVISSDGMAITQGGNEVADFGSTVVIGEVGSNKSNVQITSGAINLRNNTTNKMILAANGSISIGNQFSVDASGNATFGGSLTIGGIVSSSAQLADDFDAAGSAAGAADSASAAQTAAITAASNLAAGSVASASAAQTAAETTAANLSTGAVASASAAQTAAETLASGLAAGSVASASAAQTAAETLASGLAAGSVASASAAQTAAELLASNLAAGSVASASAAETLASNLAAGSVASASAAETLASNLAAGARASASAASSAASTAQNAIDAMETQVVLDTNGMTLRAQSGDPDVAIFGTTTKFFDGVGDADANRKLQLNADGVFVFGTNTNTFAHLGSHGLTIASGSVDVALFSETTRIGALNQGHITASSEGLTIMDSATKVGRFGAGGAIIGDETKTHISASTTELNILQGGLVSASFGLETTIGSTIGNHVQIDSDGVSIKSGNITFLSASSAGLEMSGSIRASSGEIGGFLIAKNSLTSNEDFNDVDAQESGVYVGTDGIAIDDAILLRANGEATASKFKFDGGSVGAFDLRSSDVNPYVAGTDTALIAETDTFNTCSIVASTAPYMEFSSGNADGKTIWSHTANGGKTIQKFVYTPADESLLPFKGFFNETGPSEINAAYIKHIASAAVGGVMTEYTNNEIGGGALAVGQRMIMYAASGSTDDASGLNRGATNLGTKTYGVGQAYQIANGSGNEWTTQITIGQIGMNVDRHRVTYDWHTNSNKPSLANGILLEGTSTTQGPAKLVLMDDAHAVFSSGSATTPALSFNSYDDGFFHDSNGLNLMVNNAHDFLFKDGGEFHADADVLAFSTTISDERLKDEVKTIEFALDKINNLRGVEYVWNRGGREGEKDLGVIAQEVEKVIPEIVRDKEMPLMDDSGETYKTVDYEKLTAVLIEGMKEQQKQIDELRQELREMKDGSTN